MGKRYWFFLIGSPLFAAAMVFGILWFIKSRDLTFAESLPKAQQDLGGDARLVGVESQTNSHTFETVSKNGNHIDVARYVHSCSSFGNRSTCKNRVIRSRRRPARGEVRRARHTLGELDEDSVERVLKRAGVDSGFVTFDGTHWKVGDFKAEFDTVDVQN